MPFVIDASVTLAWGLRDEATTYSDAVLDQVARDEVWAPPIWALEVGNVVLVSERRGRITVADSTAFLHELVGLPIKIEASATPVIWGSSLALARNHNLTVYDASYLDLALRLALPLATQDNRLRAVATQLGIPIFVPAPPNQTADSTPNGA